MSSALRSYLGQRTTIQGFAVLGTVVTLLKLHVISPEAASGCCVGALTLIGLPESSQPVHASQALPIQQPVAVAPETPPAGTAAGGNPIPVHVIGDKT